MHEVWKADKYFVTGILYRYAKFGDKSYEISYCIYALFMGVVVP